MFMGEIDLGGLFAMKADTELAGNASALLGVTLNVIDLSCFDGAIAVPMRSPFCLHEPCSSCGVGACTDGYEHKATGDLRLPGGGTKLIVRNSMAEAIDMEGQRTKWAKSYHLVP